MATRCKTVEFVFPTEQATLAAGAQRSLTATLGLPESGTVFRSVTLETGCTDEITAGASAGSVEMEFALSASDPHTVTVSGHHNTGESSVHHFSCDLTEYFNTNWAAPSRIATMAITIGTNATNNHWAKLRITYDYDDQSERHVKTIWYPIEGTRDLLTTTYQTLGGAAAIPAIRGGASILPEHDVTIHQVWIELIGNQATANTSDFGLAVKLAGEAYEQTALYRVEAALATPGWLHAIWDVSNSDLLDAQALEVKVTTTTDRVGSLCGWIGITYEYAPVGTSLVWNSLMLPAFDNQDQHASRTLLGWANPTQHVKELWIEEPSTISIRPSQVFAFYDDNALSSSVSLGVNYSHRTISTSTAGSPNVVSLRLDDGGILGEGISLTRGRNKIKIQHLSHVDNAGAVSAVNGFMIVNYTSGVSQAGIGAHNQTRHFALGYVDSASTSLEYTVDTSPSYTPAIPEERYFLNAVALRAAWNSTGDSQQALRVQVQRTGDEGITGDGVGWANAYRGAIASGAEDWLHWTTGDCTDLFRRWASDPDLARMDVEADRRWMVLNASGVYVRAVGLLVTYHAIAMIASGTVSGAAEDGSGLRVNLSRDATGEKVLEVLTTTGGAYEAPWYDDTESLVADVYSDDDGLVGRSAPFYATGLYEPPPAPDPDPRLHRETHELGGDDAIDVTGLSGVLADPQTAIAHAASHLSDGSDPIATASTSAAGIVRLAADGGTTAGLAVQANDTRLAAATTSTRGTVELATDVETTAGLAVQASDARLIDSRNPNAHATSHKSAGGDSIKLDELAAPNDNTDLNATTSAHGLLPKLDNDVTHVLSGIGTWVAANQPLDTFSHTSSGSYTWTKPTTFTPRMVMVICIGGGGGGGGGGSSASGNSTGGCGGGGGAYSVGIFPAALLGSAVNGVVGAGGGGGNGGNNGSIGGVGGETTFGTGPYYVWAGGGGGGYQGLNTADAGQGGGGGGLRSNGQVGVGGITMTANEGRPGLSNLEGTELGASGGTGCRGGHGSSVATSAEYGGGGGGGRASTSTGMTAGGSSLYGGGGGGTGSHGTGAGGTAGGTSGSVTAGGGGAGGSTGNPPTAGSAGSSGDGIRWAGSGGGGGGAHTGGAANGAAGGAGGVPGGGGGGGGHAKGVGNNGGNGGAGARGEVHIYTW